MADGCIIDTDVISYLFRGDTRADEFRLAISGRIAAVSFMTVAELDRWVIERQWGNARIANLARYLEAFAIVIVDRDMCRTWARIMADAKRDGRPILTADAWIAATALTLNVPLVTHNRDDYASIRGLTLIP